MELKDIELASFLNGFIIEKRGKKDGPQPKPENRLTNNMILRKLKIALNLQSDEILTLFKSQDRVLSKHELSAFFRKPENSKFKYFNDQYLRVFLQALQDKLKKD